MHAMSSQPAVGATPAKIAGAFAAIYLVWGTTYLAIKLVLVSLPPFTSGGLRMSLAGLLMFVWLRWRGSAPLAGVNWRLAAVCGVLMPGIGNGFVVWAQQGVPSGIAALVVASVPAFVLLFNWLLFARVAPSRVALTGIAFATSGLVVVVTHTRELSGHVTVLHLVALVCAVIAWSIGTLLQRRVALNASISAFTCAQLCFGGLFQGLLAVVNAEWRVLDPARFTLLAGAALLYLATFGSVVAFNCYLWLLQRVPAQRVATYAVVNPLVALVLGAVFLGEPLSLQVWLAVVLVLAGVGAVLFEGRLLAWLVRPAVEAP
jgi:drug/metabolite transporter (DMT)-like permease